MTTTDRSADRRVEAPVHRPAIPGSVLALAAGVVSVALLLDTPEQWRALFVELAGLALVATGLGLRRRRPRTGPSAGVVGGLLAAVGATLVAAGFGVALTRPPATIHRLELVPGMLGLVVLLAGLLPLRPGAARSLVTAGAALLFLGVLTSGVVRSATLLPLLLAGLGAILAWDAGEGAVSLGNQVGRGAGTLRAELVRGAASLAVGLGGVAAALGVHRLGVEGLPLAGLAALLVAGVALVLALRQ